MAEMRLLLVDDEEDFIEVLAMRLGVRGFDVRTAPNGEAAIEIAKGETLDVAILDLSMPGMDGVETLVGLREINPDLKVILLTGHSTTDRGEAALALGAADFMSKPADFDDLLVRINKAAGGRAPL